MPYKTEKIKFNNPKLDRRVKMMPTDKEMAKEFHKKGMSIRAIARYFKVTRRLIQFILFPEKKKKNLADRKKRGGWKQYYDKKHHAENMREHRKYKYLTLTGKNNNDFLIRQSEKIKTHKKNRLKEIKMDEIRRIKSREELKNWYVLSLLKWSNGDYSGLSSSELKKYPQLINAMRAHIKFKRLIQNN